VPTLPQLLCSNVLLDGSLSVAKVADLGKSGILQASVVTRQGTPNRYSSPEQLPAAAAAPRQTCTAWACCCWTCWRGGRLVAGTPQQSCRSGSEGRLGVAHVTVLLHVHCLPW
jgi:hypothetical protein